MEKKDNEPCERNAVFEIKDREPKKKRIKWKKKTKKRVNGVRKDGKQRKKESDLGVLD